MVVGNELPDLNAIISFTNNQPIIFMGTGS